MNLTIGYPKNFSTSEFHQAIVEFNRIYPEVNISVVSGTHEELFELLVQHHIDVKISEQRRTFNEDYYNYELKHSECFVEISSMNPLSKKEILTTDDLKNMSCILVVLKIKKIQKENFMRNHLIFQEDFCMLIH